MGDFVMLAAALRSHRQLHASGIAAYALLFAAVANISPARAAEHTLMPSPQTVHIGYFLASIKPVLSIESGDVVTLESVAAIVPSVVDQAGVVSPGAVPQYHRDIYGEVKDRGPGPHVLTGPIEVKGAMPGDVLEVRILDINLILDWGYIASGLIPAPCRRNSRGSGRGSFRSTAKPRPRRWQKAWSCRSTVRSSAPWG